MPIAHLISVTLLLAYYLDIFSIRKQPAKVPNPTSVKMPIRLELGKLVRSDEVTGTRRSEEPGDSSLSHNPTLVLIIVIQPTLKEVDIKGRIWFGNTGIGRMPEPVGHR
jgi:hypothetical protein